MKIFKYTALFFLALLILFFGCGIVVSEIKYTNRVVVNKDCENSFKVFNDTSMMKEWLQGFVSLQLVKGEYMQEGSKYRLILEQDGDQYEMDETLISVMENRHCSFFLENDVLTNRFDVHFNPVDKGTEIKVDNTVKGKNILWRAIFFVLQHKFYDQGKATYNSLKAVIERK
jgi:hypothetical protein